MTAQSYFENSFRNYTLDWKQICLLPRIITINSYHRNLQCKILHNVLYLDKINIIFKIYRMKLFLIKNIYAFTLRMGW